MADSYLLSKRDGAVVRLTLNRPEIRNALNPSAIAELTAWAESIRGEAGVRAVVLDANGPAFCAGADLKWFLSTAGHSDRENREDAAALARMFVALDQLPVPLVARVHGAALGGGAGLLAVCDIVVADDRAEFGFTEVKLGLLPAVIAPFVLAKIGRSAARELFLTGARFSASRAREIGLVHVVAPHHELDLAVAKYLDEVIAAGPEAIGAAKTLVASIADQPLEAALAAAEEAIVTRRASREGQEGLRAFLEKRKPNWTR